LSGSASIGTSALINNSNIASIVIGVTTLSVGLLGTISSFFAWAKRSESHRIAAITYKKLVKIAILAEIPRLDHNEFF
jgi:hypothetical protein